ncbi:MAG: SMC-Scp complex subunit ScpB [Gammaproteobacteria bacterium]
MDGELKNIIEALLLASDAPLSVSRIQGLFAREARPGADAVKAALSQLQRDCEARAVELRKIGNAYRYQSRRQYANWIAKLHAASPPKLSRALLETLAIIAYRQPVTRGDIEEIRGVNVTPDIMRRLLEREWIAEAGARDLPGRPALFATTPEFLSYFNLKSLDDLPPLSPQRALGEIAGEINAPAEVLSMLRTDAQAGGGGAGGDAAQSES